MPTDRQKDRWTDRQMTDRQKDRQTFQLSYQNKSILECQKDVKASVRQTGRYTEWQADSAVWQRDRMTVWQIAGQLKSPLLFSCILITRQSSSGDRGVRNPPRHRQRVTHLSRVVHGLAHEERISYFWQHGTTHHGTNVTTLSWIPVMDGII